MNASRLPYLDDLRGIAIAAVLFHHCAVFDAGPDMIGGLYAAYAEFASHGVDLFFALSGFLLVRQLPEVPAPHSMRDFWVRRAAKILPLYLLTLFVALALLPALLNLLGATERGASLSTLSTQWPWHASFTSNWLFFNQDAFVHPLLNVTWSLAVEVQFYLILSISVLMGLARSARFWLALALCALVVRVAAVGLDWSWVRIYNFTPARLDAFAAGALVALRPHWFGPGLRILGISALLAPGLLGWHREAYWVQIAGYSWVALTAAALIAPVRPSETPIRRSPLAILGLISYSIYLTHPAIRSVVRDLFFPAPRALDTFGDWLRFALYTSIVYLTATLIGWLAWRFLERPAQRFLLAWTDRRLKPAHPAPS